MKKTKKIAINILMQGLGVACDLALIHNFFRQDQWNLYCQRYISMFTAFSWVAMVSAFLVVMNFEIAIRSDDYRRKNAEGLKKSAKDLGPRLWKTIWRWTETIPMLVFVGIFVGNFHLFTVWLLCTLGSVWTEHAAKRLHEKFEKGAQTFTEVMEELSKKSTLN